MIDAFVDALNVAELGFDGVKPAAMGRPSYHPSCLLKLYIYGYLNRVQSSRRLGREAGRNVEVMWLLGRLAPDHKNGHAALDQQLALELGDRGLYVQDELAVDLLPNVWGARRVGLTLLVVGQLPGRKERYTAGTYLARASDAALTSDALAGLLKAWKAAPRKMACLDALNGASTRICRAFGCFAMQQSDAVSAQNW